MLSCYWRFPPAIPRATATRNQLLPHPAAGFVGPQGGPHREGEVLARYSVLQPVTESSCVAARPGGEQLEVNDPSETQVNSIRPETVASLPKSGESQTCEGAMLLSR